MVFPLLRADLDYMLETDTTGTYFVLLRRYHIVPEEMEGLEELLLKSIPLHWKQEGLIDYQVMKSKDGGSFLVLSQWRSASDAMDYGNNQQWEEHHAQQQRLIEAGVLEVTEVLSEQYQLVE